MSKRKERIKHLASIAFSQNNCEYINFMIGIFKMQKFEKWEKILVYCKLDYFWALPCMTYSYDKYRMIIKKYCKDELNMNDCDFSKYTFGYNYYNENIEVLQDLDDEELETSISLILKDYESSSPKNKTIIRQDPNTQKIIDSKWVYINLDTILEEELPDFTQEKIQRIKEIALNLQAINESTLKNIDFRILQDKYLQIFDKQQIAQIVSYPVIQDEILNLDSNELECLDIVVKDYIERENFLFCSDEEKTESNNYKISQWTQMTEKFLVSLVSCQYSDVIEDIGKVEDDNRKKELYKKLGYIMCDANVYEIRTIEELENFEGIQAQVCKKIIYDEDIIEYPQLLKMDEISRKRFAIMQRFGISSGLELSKMFDDDIATIPVKENSSEEIQIQYLLAIKQLYKTNNKEEFKELFKFLEQNSVPYIPLEYGSQKILEKKLKLLYEKTYNKSLTNIEKLKQISDERKKELNLQYYEGKVVEVGEDFNLIVTSISPFIDTERKIENIAEDWQRSDLKSQLASFSNITAERFRTTEIPFSLLGFDRLEGVDMQAPLDNASETRVMTPFCECNWFTMPGKNGIGKFNTITEINAKRITPSYIPVIRKNLKLINLDNSIMAAKQFQQKNNETEPLPLVVIDVDKLIYLQSKKLLSLIQQFRISPNKDVLREIAGCLGNGDGGESILGVNYGYITKDLQTQNFINTEEYATTCDLSKLVEYINNLPYAKEKNIEEQLGVHSTIIDESTLSQLYQRTPLGLKDKPFDAIIKKHITHQRR